MSDEITVPLEPIIYPKVFKQFVKSLTDSERVEWDLLISNGVTERRARELILGARYIPVRGSGRTKAMLQAAREACKIHQSVTIFAVNLSQQKAFFDYFQSLPEVTSVNRSWFRCTIKECTVAIGILRLGDSDPSTWIDTAHPYSAIFFDNAVLEGSAFQQYFQWVCAANKVRLEEETK